jgi:hypothetical protein
MKIGWGVCAPQPIFISVMEFANFSVFSVVNLLCSGTIECCGGAEVAINSNLLS